MENTIDELLGNLDQTQDEVFIDDQITEAALAGHGFLITKLEDQRRKAEAQEFAGKCKAAQDRLDEIKLERDHTLSEIQAFTQQLELAGAELRRAEELAYDRRVEYNGLQLKLGFLDGKIEVLREEYTDKSNELRELLASRNGGIDQ